MSEILSSILTTGDETNTRTSSSFVAPQSEKRSTAGIEQIINFPQAIAHRGFQAKYPENTMESFMGAVTAGAHAIETDLHVTRDKIVVLSHDTKLLRCFGVNKKISEVDYSYIETLRTIRSPHLKMPTLRDLLEYLRQPEMQHIWLLLDIKADNDPEEVVRLTGEMIFDVGGSIKFWNGRIHLGCWLVEFVPLCQIYISGCPITHIGYSIPYARQFLEIPDISFNLGHIVLSSDLGLQFLHDAKKVGRKVFGWTINEKDFVKWSICHKLDGVCIDDPIKFFEICDDYDPGSDCQPYIRTTWTKKFLTSILSLFFELKYFYFLRTRRKVSLPPPPGSALQ